MTRDNRLLEYVRIFRVIVHCLLLGHHIGRWKDDWMRPHWYCQECNPRSAADKMFFSDY